MKNIDEFVKQNKSSSSKFKDIHDFIGKPQVESYKEADKKFNPVVIDKSKPFLTPQNTKVSADPKSSPVMKSIDQFVKDNPKEPTWNGVIDNPIGRTAGKVLGGVAQGFEVAKKVTGLDRVQGAVRGLSTADYPTHTSDGTYLGEYKSLAQNAVEGAGNIVKSTVQGFLHPKEADKKFEKIVDKGLEQTNPITRFAGKMVAESATDPTSYIPIPVSQIVKGFKALPSTVSTAFDRFASRNSPIADFAPEVKPTLALPPASAESMAAFNKRNGNVLPTNETPIHGKGNIQFPETLQLNPSPQYDAIQRIKAQQTLNLPEANPKTVSEFNRRNGNVQPTNNNPIYGQGDIAEPLGLPQGNYVKPTRLKVNSANETLDHVITKIRPEVISIIEAPTRRDLLVSYVQKNTGYPIEEIHNMPLKDLQDYGQMIQNKLQENMEQIAYDVASKHGYDLPSLFKGEAPSVSGQIAKDAQSRVYGVPAEKVNIAKPQFNKEVTGQAAAPRQGLAFKREPKAQEANSIIETPLQKQQRLAKQIKSAEDKKKISELSKPIIGRAAMPETKVGKAPTLKEATTKANVEPVNGTVTKKEAVITPTAKVDVISKSDTLKPKVEVKRTVNPTQRVSGIRANYQNQLKNGNLSPELQAKIKATDQSYEKITNKGSDEVAKEAVKNLSKAESDFLLNETGGADHIATGYRLQQKLDDMGEHARALVVSNKLAKDLTKSGQTNQAGSIISRLSPEGQLLNLIRTAEKNGKTVSVKDSVEFKTQAKKAREKAGAGVQANQFTEILDRAAKGESLTADDVKKMGDYLASAEKNSAKSKAIKVVDDLPNELKEPRKRERIISYLDEAEKAALARIAARKSKVSAMVLPNLAEWADHSIVVAAQITKGSIKAATHIEDLVKLFGEEIRPVATQVFQKAQSLVKSVSPSIGLNDMTKANKAFERISGQTKEVNFQEKIVEKYLKENPKVSPKDIDTLRELAKNVTQLSGNEGIKADIAMQKILNNYEKSTPWDKVKAIRYMAMLLNSGTQLVNAASGPIMATLGHTADVFGVMIDTAMHHALKTPRSTTLYGTNPLRFMADYTKNLLKVGMPSGWYGVNPAGIQNVGEIRGLTFKSNYNPLNWAERTLGAVAKGTDYATYKTIYDSEIRKSGFLEAVSSGISRSDKAAIKSYVEKFVNEPTEAAMLQADRIGKNTTFQRSDSIGGSTANFLNSGNAKVKKYVSPVVNAVIPFVKTPINIASTAVTMTPAGILKGLWQLTSKSPASQREAIRTLSLSLTGSAGIGTIGYYLSQLGIITGANDSGDKNVDAIKEQAEQGKYRFNTSALKRYMSALLNGEGADGSEKAAKYQEGDHTFDYNKFQPIAFPLAIGASLGKTTGKPMLGRLEKAGGDAYGSLFGMSTLKGIQDVFQPQYSGTQGEKSIGVASRIAESFFKSFSPSMLAQEARRQDPIVRKTPYNNGITEDVKGYFKSRTPGLSESMPESKTTLGMNKMNAAGFSGQYINPYKSEIAAYSKAAVIISDLIDKTGDNSLAPSVPDKNVKFKNKAGEDVTVLIPQDRYEQLQEDVGHNIILKILAIPDNIPDAKKVDKIKDIYESVRKKEKDKVTRELKLAAN